MWVKPFAAEWDSCLADHFSEAISLHSCLAGRVLTDIGVYVDLAKFLPVSWRTTLAGVIVLLGVLATELSTLTDDDPKTNPNVGAIVSAFAAFAGFSVARDRKVSTEQERGRPVTTAQELAK